MWARVVRVACVEGGRVAGFGSAGLEGMERRRWAARIVGARSARRELGMRILRWCCCVLL